ncbi:helix-turn-helix domain-containing protein [Carnobacterium maltaromaticum]|uniref:helix-turn-helix domain-containing protein n=1 Tax=Carnobacterium maltaromaticum TaxID=2751 RepID=UPI001071E9C6|nr:helix-turn-helix transcriptional regulator [Carnobacterium maltaromaticum]TFJ72017.1 transcriptional regulator [Carnobacterium maltaromaticum]TFJ76930.1 transcriptional regulator [Carnobacterium maltaromaticum]
MMLLGDLIKAKRLENGLTQAELAAGICTQASISNLEKNQRIPPLMTLLAIGNRLNLNFDELSDYAIEQENLTSDVFNRVRTLRKQFKLKEAYDLIIEELPLDKLKTYHKKKQYYYYLGITGLLGYNKISEAHYNFNLALSSESEPNLDFYDILTINGIGLAYYFESEEEKARTYFEKSLVQLDQFMSQMVSLDESIEITKLYYATAKFYSEIKEYSKAVDLCSLGIQVQLDQHVNYELEMLYYEKAFNLAKLNKKSEAEECYYYATALAKMINNTMVVETIKENIIKFRLNSTNDLL